MNSSSDPLGNLGPRDCYAVLGVDPGTDCEAIRAAYRTLALRHHPDHPEGSVSAMVALNHAWAVLRDPSSRAIYDQWRDACLARPPTPVWAMSEPRPRASFEAGPLARRQVAQERDSTILRYGRHAGESLADVARSDPDYLKWLVGTPAGRSLRGEIGRLVGSMAGAPRVGAHR